MTHGFLCREQLVSELREAATSFSPAGKVQPISSTVASSQVGPWGSYSYYWGSYSWLPAAAGG